MPDLSDAFASAPAPGVVAPIAADPDTLESKPVEKRDLSDAFAPLPTQSGYVAAGGKTSWGDYATAILGTGMHQAGAATAGLLGSVMSGESREQMDWAAKQESEAALRSRQSMTPAAQQGGIGITLAEQVPSMVAAGGAEMLGGPLAAGAVFAAQSRGGLEARGATEGFKPTQAELAIPTMTGFLAGAIPGAGLPGKIATGAAPRYALGLGQGTLTFGAQSAADEAVAQHARIGAGLQKDYDVGKIGEEAVTGGAYGLGFSGLHIPERAKVEEKPAAKQTELHTEAPAGQAGVTRSDREGRKPEAQTGPGGKPAPVPDEGFEEIPGKPFARVKPEESGPAPPPDPAVDPGVAIAAKGEGARPAAETGTPPGKIEPAPTPASEEAPAPQRAPPSEELQQQHAELMDKDHPREMMQYPPGTEPIPITERKQRFGSRTLDDDSTIVYDRSGKSKIKKEVLDQADKEGRLDEYIQDKLKVPEKVTPGELPEVAPPLETPQEPQGAPLEPVEAPPATPIAETETPPSEGSLEAPRGQPVEVALPEPAPAPVAEGVRVPPGVAEEAMAQPRVLEDVTAPKLTKAEELKAKAAAKKEAQKTKRMEKKQAAVQKELETGEAQKIGGRGWSKEEKAAKETNNVKAREVVMRHLPKGEETLEEQHARAKAMFEDATKEGVNIPDQFRGDHLNSDDVILLAEARARAKSGKGEKAASTRFGDREKAYYKEAGKIGEIRRAESAELGTKGSKAKEGEEAELPEAGAVETHVEEPEEKIEQLKEQREAEERDAAERAKQAEKEAKEAAEAKEAGVPEAEPDVRGFAAREAPTVTGKGKLAGLRPEVKGKISLGPKAPKAEELKAKAAEKPEHAVIKVEGATPRERARNAAEQRLEAAGVGEKGESVRTVDRLSRRVSIQALRSGTVKSIVGKYFDLKHYSPELHDLVQHIYDKVMEIAGNVPMHFITDEDMKRTNGQSRGVYISERERATGNLVDHYIFLNVDHLAHDTPFHEAFHAASQIAINSHLELKAKLELLRKHVLNSPELEKVREQWKANPQSVPHNIRNAFLDVHEFITTMMTRPEVQDALKHIKIPRELADKLGIPKWRRATGWEGFLANIRQLFGLGPRETSAIEAVASLTEQVFHTHPSQAGELMAYAGRLSKAEAEEQAKPMAERMFDPVERSRDEKEMGESYRDLGVRIARDARTNLGAKIQKTLPKLMNMTQLATYYKRLFTDGQGNIISHIAEIGRRMGVEMNKLRDTDFGTYIQSRINAEKFTKRQGDYAKLWEMSNNYNIDASKAPGKLKKKIEDEDINRHQHNEFHPEAHELYNSLPPEMRKQYNDEMQFFKDKRKAMAEQRVDSIIDHNHLPAGVTDKAALRQRIIDGEMTDDDLQHYHNLKLNDDLNEARRLIRGQQVYAPAYRSGDFVVKGRYEMPDGGHDTDISGKALPDHVRQFDTRKELHDFVTKTRLRATNDIVYYAKDTGEKVVGLEKEKAEDTARGGPRNVVQRFEARLQREHMEMHKSYADAERAQEAMRQGGVKELSGVLDRRQEGDWGKINSEHANAMEKNISHRSDLSPQEKKAAIQAMRDYELVHGSALKSHLVARRYVGGADYGHADAIRSYSEAANRHMVNVKFRTDMDNAMRRMEEQDKLNSRNREDSYQSATVMNELRNRVYRDPDALSYKNAPWINRLMAISYMKYMFGPRHMMMLQTHPLVYSAPEMAGRHGMAASVAALHKAAGDLGGVFLGAKEGLKTTGKMIKSLRETDPEKAAELAKSMDISKSMLSNLSGDRLRAMQQLGETGHTHAGADDTFYGSTGFDKVDALMRQQSRLQDAQNRHVVGLGAFDLEYAKTGDFEGSVKYAQKVIEKTIGVHSGLDIGSAMKNPLVRSFMQFKHFPLRQAELMFQNVHAAFRGETKEIRQEAMKAAAYQAGSSFSMAGVHGLPIGLIKPLGIIGSALGITPTPTQIDDRTRRELANMFGTTLAKGVMDGASSLIPHMPNLDNMFSRDFDAMFGEQKHDDLKGFLLNEIGGAPISVLGDAFKGLEYTLHGDMTKALEFAPLPRTLGDIARAYGLFQHGATTATGKSLTPASNIDAAWRVMGFGTKQEQAAQTGRAASEQDIQQLPKTTKGDQLKAKAKEKQTIMGITPSKRTKALLEEREAVYQ